MNDGYTKYHAQYYAYELTRRYSSDSFEKMGSTLVDAQVDLNPHQVDAAIFAFHTPLSKGAILADEVGLGKTIEAGLVISQKWAERKRRILIITPSNLRKQWNLELNEKFFLPSVILETKSFNQEIKKGNLNPFAQDEKIVIISLHFARSKSPYIEAINWDLVVIDEAHRLRNVYKPQNKIARTIKDAIQPYPKLLLTATPLQNSLLELYGLVSIIDDQVFGDLSSFKIQFTRNGGNELGFLDLKNRLAPICKRTLRRQVLEYIQYTNRVALTQTFTPYEDEQLLYMRISDYLQRPNLYALPSRQRALMELIMRKLLASSSFAIARTLEVMADRLRLMVEREEAKSLEQVHEIIATDFEPMAETADEWVDFDESDDEEVEDAEEVQITPEDIEKIKLEIAELDDLTLMAKQIVKNSKGESLVIALKQAFEKVKENGGHEKAIIFTESRRTQEYILDILSATEYKDKTVLFNGSNTDQQSRQIYKEWYEKNKNTDRFTGSKTADMRTAIVDYFEDTASIMIATEAAAEGINLQFCSLVVNYDLPWNPQRIEQRIGRCHRYGQKNDVVVVNFLNIKNAADIRVYELLDEKFKLFSGVFGASDEVLGSIESGVDFEKRIIEILQKCRNIDEIQSSFDTLRSELDDQIDETMRQTRQKLFTTFDEEVHQKLRFYLEKTKDYVGWFESKLWDLTKYSLRDYAVFNDDDYSFYLNSNPYSTEEIPSGPYRLAKNVQDSHIFRPGHPLAEQMLANIKNQTLESAQVQFNYSDSPVKISLLEKLIGKSGWLTVDLYTFTSLENEDYLVLSGVTENGEPLDQDICKKLFSIPSKLEGNYENCPYEDILESQLFRKQQEIIEIVSERNSQYFDQELEKLDKWAEDVKNSLEIEIKNLDREIKLKRTETKKILLLKDKVEAQRVIKEMEKNRKNLRQRLFIEQDKADERKESLLSELEAKMKQETSQKRLFTLQWRLI
jgi:ERCC4-related helicase